MAAAVDKPRQRLDCECFSTAIGVFRNKKGDKQRPNPEHVSRFGGENLTRRGDAEKWDLLKEKGPPENLGKELFCLALSLNG